MPDCLVSFGSNLGDREKTIREALSLLQAIPECECSAVSSLIETLPVGGEEGQEAFLNGVVRFDCELSAEELHERLRLIERKLGRERHERWSARTLDLDLIAYGDSIIDEEELRVPHPRMSFRSFVLKPACEVSPDWVHPELGATLSELDETLLNGQNVVQVLGEIGPLVRVELSLMGLKVPVLSQLQKNQTDNLINASSTTGKPRLLIDASLSGPRARFLGGPRLSLADCPTESWRTEVRAALECVWPMCDNAN